MWLVRKQARWPLGRRTRLMERGLGGWASRLFDGGGWVMSPVGAGRRTRSMESHLSSGGVGHRARSMGGGTLGVAPVPVGA